MIFLILAQIISWVCNILILILLARSVLSWVVFSGYRRNPTLMKIYQVLTDITEPIVAPLRRLISRFVRPGPVDFAPLLAFFLLIIISRILTRILIALI